jgi:polysaccharide biosynthesis/export protein
MSFRLFLALVVSLTAFSGCAAQSNVSSNVASAEAPPVYRLDSGDKIRVTVYGEQSVNGEYAIGPEGDIAFPLIGSVVAKQQTVEELRQAIVAKLAAGYLVDPRVTIEVLSYRPYYILGEVSRPGQYAYATALSVDQAIATAGGYTYRASKSKVFIRRAGGAEVEVKLEKGRPMWINPGDTIRIGERYF